MTLSAARRWSLAASMVLLALVCASCAAKRAGSPAVAFVTSESAPKNPSELLRSVNEAMAALDNVHVIGQFVHKRGGSPEVAYEEVDACGKFTPTGDLQATQTFVYVKPSGAVSHLYEYRRVGGVVHFKSDQDEWTVKPEAWTDDVSDRILSGRIALSDATVTTEILDGGQVYRIAGHASEKSSETDVTLWVDADDLLIRRMQIQTQKSDDYFRSDIYHVVGHNEHLTVAAPNTEPKPPLSSAPQGQMATYVSADLPISIQYPADLEQRPTLNENITANYVGNGCVFSVVEEDIAELGLEGMFTLSTYTDASLSTVSDAAGYRLVSRKTHVTAQDLEVEIVEYTAVDVFRCVALVCLWEGRIGFVATYMFPKGERERFQPLAEKSFDTLRIGGDENEQEQEQDAYHELSL